MPEWTGRCNELVATYAAMKSGLKACVVWIIRLLSQRSNLCRDEKRTERSLAYSVGVFSSVATYAAMKSGLKATPARFLLFNFDEVATYAAMKSGLKVVGLMGGSIPSAVATYAAMKSGLKVCPRTRNFTPPR